MAITFLNNKSIYISIIISVVSIIITTAINIRIANEYLRVDGKTKALFGLKEILQFSYQYYVCILGVAAMIFAVLAKTKAVSKTMTLLLAISTIVLVFVRFWRLLV
jgi:hypothetical membrane protein